MGQGRTIAATAGMLLGLTAAALAAPAATPAQKAQPRAAKAAAVAAGRSADGKASCRLAARERIVARSGRLRIARTKTADGTDTVVAYRVCLAPHGRYLPLRTDTVGAGEPDRGFGAVAHRIRGPWFVWTESHSTSRGEWTGTETYRARVGERAVTRQSVGAGTVAALASDGTVVLLDGTTHRDSPVPGTVEVVERQRLYVAGPGARAATLIARVRAEGEGSGPIADVRLSADGRTVAWTENGVARRAPTESTVVTAGSSADGVARFRLQGRSLTVTLSRPLAPNSSGGRPSVVLTCGENLVGGADRWLVVRAGRDLRVRPGARTVRTRLDADVARQANWCELRSVVAGRTTAFAAEMTLVRGTRPSCDVSDGGTLLAESDKAALLTFTRGGASETVGIVRACWKPTGASRQLAAWGPEGQGGPSLSGAVAGRWAVWSASSASLVFQRVDLATGAVEALPTVSDDRGRPVRIWSVAVAADGRVAWVQTLAGEPSRIVALVPTGQPVVLAEEPAYMSQIRIWPVDGSTVTWTGSGGSRSAVLP